MKGKVLTMELSIPVARKVVEDHYAERGLVFAPNHSDAEVLRVYHNLQEENKESKRWRWEPFSFCGLTLKHAHLIEEDEPAGSQ